MTIKRIISQESSKLAVFISSQSLLIFLITLGLVSCTSSKCRRKDHIPPVAAVTKEAISKDLKISTPHDKNKGQTVLIYKYDGSLQCQVGGTIPLDEMARELKGIKIISKENRSDRLLHVQLCGAITGQANFYEIQKENLSEAQTRGFKLWRSD